MIISVGYRVNSKRGTQFRIWATGVLREHLTRGLTINRQRLEENAQEIEAARRWQPSGGIRTPYDGEADASSVCRRSPSPLTIRYTSPHRVVFLLKTTS